MLQTTDRRQTDGRQQIANVNVRRSRLLKSIQRIQTAIKSDQNHSTFSKQD